MTLNVMNKYFSLSQESDVEENWPGIEEKIQVEIRKHSAIQFDKKIIETCYNTFENWVLKREFIFFQSWEEFISDLITYASSQRLNSFSKNKGVNFNGTPVHTGIEPNEFYNGFIGVDFFKKELWDVRLDNLTKEYNVLRSHEQEYVLQSINKGALNSLRTYAQIHQICIAVRPTGPAGLMHIEAGNPTKPQEFKNKTSKDEDMWLCDQLEYSEVGAVVHYDPAARFNNPPGYFHRFINYIYKSFIDCNHDYISARLNELQLKSCWLRVKDQLEEMRRNKTPRYQEISRSGLSPLPTNDAEWRKLEQLFISRHNEYQDYNNYYVGGKYSDIAFIKGPYLRLAKKPNMNVFGDHDLFGYGKLQANGEIFLDKKFHEKAQVSLQNSTRFQAQHGGIAHWNPEAEAHDVAIKTKIMAAHSAPNGKPLICALPNGRIGAYFFLDRGGNGNGILKPVWDDDIGCSEWLRNPPTMMHAGHELAPKLRFMLSVIKGQPYSVAKGPRQTISFENSPPVVRSMPTRSSSGLGRKPNTDDRRVPRGSATYENLPPFVPK